jgi:hypothetical protein
MAESKAPKQMRRSTRRPVAIPIRVFGTTLKGRQFSEDCVCVKVSKHGAQIRTQHLLVPDDTVHVTNRRNSKEASFRVVTQVESPPGVTYVDWGLEALGPNDIWD